MLIFAKAIYVEFDSKITLIFHLNVCFIAFKAIMDFRHRLFNYKKQPGYLPIRYCFNEKLSLTL
ncbi:hypothetical protein N824_02545 [Pedobacter sp. V48]|nr:hypothetical protein N824_02545 [Pedobacter sp. V48]